MGELIGALALLALTGAVVAVVALWRERSERKQHYAANASVRAATWEVGEAGAFGHTKVFVRKVTADGDEVDRIAVAEVPDKHPDWDARIADARAAASSRAALLNTKP